MGIRDSLDDRKTTFGRILQDLIEKPPARFDQHLDTALPTAHGLYAISVIAVPEGEYLHIGEGHGPEALFAGAADGEPIALHLDLIATH